MPIMPRSGVQVTSFKAPTPEDLAHDFLWRVHQHTPERGMIGIFNRSHYEDVLIVRVEKLVSKDIWKARYDHINAFENLLADSGVTILKFFLHISKDEQRQRFLARIDDKDKHWKFSTSDVAERGFWDKYMQAYEDALGATSTEWAPWYVVPADHKWYRNLVVATIMVETLKSLKMRYPEPKEDLDRVVIE